MTSRSAGIYLQTIAAAMGTIYNCLVAYDAWGNPKKFAWQILTVALLAYSTFRFAQSWP